MDLKCSSSAFNRHTIPKHFIQGENQRIIMQLHMICDFGIPVLLVFVEPLTGALQVQSPFQIDRYGSSCVFIEITSKVSYTIIVIFSNASVAGWPYMFLFVYISVS